ncbi:MAG: ribulose-phosphate 3-epimerase [Clostridia bacterium]|nr:ribulose-phosphate 3-epimerase [Clostridia bacterium]
MTKVAPSILSGDFAKMGESVSNAESWGADYIHCDVMDGVYVPNITFGMPMIKALRPYSSLTFDVHLMITEPEKYVEQFCDAGADIVTFHPEASKDVDKAIDLIKNKGKKVGLVLNPDKHIELLLPYLKKIDMIVIMGVYPGFGGQRFIPDVLGKAKVLKRVGFKGEIELDGGVTEENAAKIVADGVDVLVGGSSVFRSSDPASTIRRLKGQ